MDVLSNRFAVIVIARQPFIDWINRVCPGDGSYTEKDMSPEVYLLESSDEDNDDRLVEIIEEHHRDIFEAELEAWWTNKKDWPKDRGLETFKEWMTVAFSSIVFDLSDTPVLKRPA